ncbi:protein transport protein Sec24C [Nilaparvata lugens]|uniref:protein transport protein Sec24C n=1 Tax=Nilaparvata lugens TaxID=108931 RepID=UPI00193D4C25|nr:protein transport protein Sec24C [Nilaparvata lugens]
MNPQYIAQSQLPPRQYGGPMPPPPQQGGFTAAPLNQMRAPQGPPAAFPQPARQNGLSAANSRPLPSMAGDQGMQMSRPPTGPAAAHAPTQPMGDAPGHPQQPSSHPPLPTDQMAGLNINGQPPPQQGFPGMPLKAGQPPPSNFISNSSFPPAVNGGSPSDNKSFDSHQQQQLPPPPTQQQQQQMPPPHQQQQLPSQQQQQLPPQQQQQMPPPPTHQQQQQMPPPPQQQQQQMPPSPHQQQQQMPPPPLQQQQQMPPQQQQQLYQQQQQQKQFMPPQYNGMPPPGQAAPRGSGMPPLPQPGNLQRSMPPPAAGKFQPMGFQSPYNAQGGHLPQQAPPSMGGMPPPGMGQGAPGMPPPLNQGYYQGEQPQPGYPAQQPGYPAQQPGYPAQQPGYPPGYPSPLGQANQAKRLDPDQMPSPIQVMQEDRKTKSGIFTTNLKGQPPPLVTTDFTVNDQGNASPRFIRSTMYNIPTTVDVMKQTSVPFGLVISPFARLASNELPPPIVNMGEIGPVRCVRCKAYMSPFMQFIDGGRRFHCLLCKGTTEVPPEYFQHLDHTGERVDKFSSPELLLGAYEYVATKEYCRIDSFQACLAQPQMMVVGDVNDMFMPLLDGFLVDPIESEMVIDQLMEQIPRMFADTRETETILAPAIQAGLEALKAAECAGKLLMFHSSLPIAEAPGKLKNRDDRKMLGTDKEKTVLAPQNNVYNNLGQDCVGAACSVDLFIFNNSYIDLATIGQICRLTGGEIFKYTYFQADLDGDRLIEDIKHDVSRPIAFDAVMRVRTSTGIRPTDFYGHFFMSNTTDMELASIDCDKAVALEIKHDDKLTEEEGVFIQTALLYTSCSGQRRVRILNLSLSTCVQMVDLYRACELDTVINFFAKQIAASRGRNEQLKSRLREMEVQRNAALNRSIELDLQRLQRIDAASAKDAETDADTHTAKAQDGTMTKRLSSFISKEWLSDDDISVYTESLFSSYNDLVVVDPVVVALLINDGDYAHSFFNSGLYVNKNVAFILNDNYCSVDSNSRWNGTHWSLVIYDYVDKSFYNFDSLSNFNKRTLDALVERLNPIFDTKKLTIVRQRDKLEIVVKHFLMEDRGTDGSSSYVDFLCHMHKEIRSLLS